MMRRLLAGLLCLLLPLTALGEFPGSSGDVQAWLDTPPDMTSGAEWYILALSRTGEYDFAPCQPALREALQAASAPTTRLKYALVLLATGSDDPVISATLAESAGQQGVMSHVYALHLMNNGVTAPGCSAESTLEALLTLQMADGGWALMGASSDPDVTAMVLQALAPHLEGEAVRAACDRALERLSALQLPAGCYASFGVPNPETTAQVLLALCEMGLDPLTDERFIKEGSTLLDGIARFRLPDGSYSHRLGDGANQNAATQVYLAMAGYELLVEGRPGLFRLENAAGAAAGDNAAEAAPVEDDDEALPASAVPEESPHTWQAVAAAVVLTLTLMGMGALRLLKKRSWKNYTALLVIAALLLALIFTLDIRSPEAYYTGELPDKPNAIGAVTLAIRCETALGHPAAAHLPADGCILPPTEIPLAPGDTVFTLLTEAAQAFSIPLESSGTPGLRYIQSISNLREFALGDLSGWLYLVNSTTPSTGCDQYTPTPGDTIEFVYTLNMGQDL